MQKNITGKGLVGLLCFLIVIAVFLVNAAPPEDQLISLNLQDVALSEVLKIFAKQGDVNILTEKTYTQKISYSANNVRFTEALDMILHSNGLSWIEKGNTIIVTAQKPARSFILDSLNVLEAKVYLKEIIPSLAGIAVHEGTNTITIRGALAELEQAESIIRDIDQPPQQVLVEARIIEVSAHDNPLFGVGFEQLDVQKPGQQETGTILKGTAARAWEAGATAGLFSYILEDNISAWFETLQTQVDSDLLANTKILATNNKPAQIITGQKLGYRVRMVTDEGTIEDVQFLEVGTMLEFTPRIGRNGYITMKLKPKVSEGTISDGLPNENTTEAETEVTVRDGQSIIIGGLLRDKTTTTLQGIPILMNIPLIGMFFSRTEVLTEKKETIVVITPHIVYRGQEKLIIYEKENMPESIRLKEQS